MMIGITYFIASNLLAIGSWILVILLFRHESFNSDGTRKFPVVTPDPNIRSTELAKHGDGVYKDLDLFFKLTLLIFTGVIVLLLKESPSVKAPLIKELVEYSRWLQCFSLSFGTLFVLTHKRSSILRWEKCFPWWHILLWGDTWGFISASLISFYFIFLGAPQLLELSGIN